LLVSTYSAGKLAVVGTNDARLDLAFHNFEQAMGVAWSPRRLAVGSRGQIWYLHNGGDSARRMAPTNQRDVCYLTRRSFITGNILAAKFGPFKVKTSDPHIRDRPKGLIGGCC
jgi:hypothetical protein